jgi:predicted dinucleotide-binding enzyme
VTTISMFGSGTMGTAIANLFAAGGADVKHISRNGNEPITGEVVVLAVPWEAFADITDRYRDQLAGRIVVDVTNPLDFHTFAELKVPTGSSAASELQTALPNTRVLKAFNTNFAATLGANQVGPNPATVLVAGNDVGAKQLVIDAVKAGGVDAIDAGELVRAHELEALGFLQLTLANNKKIGWSGGFGVVR